MTKPDTAPASHNRSLSSSSGRDTVNNPLGSTSPTKTQSRSIFGGPPPLASQPAVKQPPSPQQAAKPTTTYSFADRTSAYTSPFGKPTFNQEYRYGFTERERREREYREREARLKEEKDRLERYERFERERPERERLDRERAEREGERTERMQRERGETLQRERQREANENEWDRRYKDQQLRQASSQDALSQVAPQREPRPYGYKAPEREYTYTPRSRPRMDTAVEDARRGSTKKRRREDDVKEVPKEPKDYAAAARPPPQLKVDSAEIDAWVKSLADRERRIAVYDYDDTVSTVAQYLNELRMRTKRGRDLDTEQDLEEEDFLGGLLSVRVGGVMMEGWRLKGEDADHAAATAPSAEVNGRVASQEKAASDAPTNSHAPLAPSDVVKAALVYGTDVYTDDSDLQSLLIHAGWIIPDPDPDLEVAMKSDAPKTVNRDKQPEKGVHVDVRIVPVLNRYWGTTRNGVKSRSWGNGHDGYSIIVEGVRRVPASRRPTT